MLWHAERSCHFSWPNFPTDWWCQYNFEHPPSRRACRKSTKQPIFPTHATASSCHDLSHLVVGWTLLPPVSWKAGESLNNLLVHLIWDGHPLIFQMSMGGLWTLERTYILKDLVGAESRFRNYLLLYFFTFRILQICCFSECPCYHSRKTLLDFGGIGWTAWRMRVLFASLPVITALWWQFRLFALLVWFVYACFVAFSRSGAWVLLHRYLYLISPMLEEIVAALVLLRLFWTLSHVCCDLLITFER